MAEPNFSIADRVFHRPTGETWILAYADRATGYLSWLGWPEGTARIDDCDLVAKGTRESRLYWATQLAKSDSPRARMAERVYPELFAEVREAMAEPAPQPELYEHVDGEGR